MPAPRLLDQALIMAGGVLLVLPGLLSDLAGLALVLPPTRALVKRALGKWLGRRLQQNQRGTGKAGNDISDQVNYTVVIP
jgi:UPF0716 protein FxsA